MKIRIKRNLVYNVFVTILFVLTVFAPDFKFLPRYTWGLAVGGFICLFDRKFVRSIEFYSMQNRNYFVILMFSMLCLAVIPFLHGTGDTSYIELLVGIALVALRNVLLIYVLYKNGCQSVFEEYCKYLVNACCVCVIFTLLFIIFPEFKTFWNYDVLAPAAEQKYYKYQYRYSISGFAAFTYSSIFSVAVIVAAYLLVTPTNKRNGLIQFIMIVLGCLFYGRVTFFGIVAALMFILFSKCKIDKLIRILSTLIVSGVGGILLINYISTINDDFLVWKEWAFAFVKQLFIEGEVTDYSVKSMFENMYFLPSFETFILGDGMYTNADGSYYMSTDVGYMRIILYSGVFGMLIAFGPMWFLLRKAYKLSFTSSQKSLFFFILIIWFVLEAKGDMYHRILMLVYPIFLGLLCDNKSRKIHCK